MLYQLDPKTNEVIAKFTNVKHACNHLMMNPASVRRAVNGRQATSYGFRWTQMDSAASDMQSQGKKSFRRTEGD